MSERFYRYLEEYDRLGRMRRDVLDDINREAADEYFKPAIPKLDWRFAFFYNGQLAFGAHYPVQFYRGVIDPLKDALGVFPFIQWRDEGVLVELYLGTGDIHLRGSREDVIAFFDKHSISKEIIPDET